MLALWAPFAAALQQLEGDAKTLSDAYHLILKLDGYASRICLACTAANLRMARTYPIYILM